MTKNEFINILDSKLKAIEYFERQEIISEYVDHIDTKISNGISEEEAVASLGDIDEFCDEILNVSNRKDKIYETDNGTYIKEDAQEKKILKICLIVFSIIMMIPFVLSEIGFAIALLVMSVISVTVVPVIGIILILIGLLICNGVIISFFPKIIGGIKKL